MQTCINVLYHAHRDPSAARQAAGKRTLTLVLSLHTLTILLTLGLHTNPEIVYFRDFYGGMIDHEVNF